MPVRQQYFIASAIIGLIGVMVIFAVFDYFSDRSRFAERQAAPSQGAVAVVQTPYPTSANVPDPGYAFPQNASWPRSYPGATRPPQAGGILYCPVCDFVMSTKHQAVPNSIRCPRCSAYLYFSGPETGGIAGNRSAGQQAGGVLDGPSAYNPAYSIPFLRGARDGFGGW